MNLNTINYLQSMGIDLWKMRSSPIDSLSLKTLCQSVRECKACALHKTRTQTVFGVGNPDAKLMLIGEAPGFHEDQQGEPFVGRAGQLLNAMLQAIGFTREEIFIANVLKCRPPNNRDPLPEEVQACISFLKKQIELIQPTLLLALGRIAAHALLNTKVTLGNMRGKIHTFNHIPLIITYHPAYLLRNPRDKNKAFDDLQFIYKTLNTR